MPTKIEWTESTWNPVTGCTKISAGCQHCYAERMAHRLHLMGQPNYANDFQVTCHPQSLNIPLRMRKPQMIFVNSMSDLFHSEIPFEFLQRIFNVMNQARWHTFQILTKRAERLAEFAQALNWTPNIWMGVTVESVDYLHRIDCLRTVPAAVRFLSMEPLLSDVGQFDLDGIDWVIVGGESGPGARPMDADWVRNIRDQCQASHVPFFFKQWGGVNKKKTGKTLDGIEWNEMPREKNSDECGNRFFLRS